MSHRPPTIRTERLLLRPHGTDDFDACAALWMDPVVTRHIGGRPRTREEAWSTILRYAGLWSLLGFGYWVVEDHTGRFVGEVGLADFRRDITPSLAGSPEAGWVLAPLAHGQGFATEAVRAVLGWNDERTGAGRTVCLIDPENLASIRVAQKCGYRELTRATYKDHPAIIFQRGA